jgi:hypothetical protein
MPRAGRIVFAASAALCLGLTAVVIFTGWSINPTVKAIETLAVVGALAAVLFGAAITIGLRMADYQEPESEEEFEQVVLRAERLAREGTAAEPDESEFLDLASIALAASLGPGVAFAAITILVVQGGISLAAGLFENILAEGSDALAALTSAGGVLIIGISLKLLDVKDVRVGNFLPALVIAPALVGVVSLFH